MPNEAAEPLGGSNSQKLVHIGGRDLLVTDREQLLKERLAIAHRTGRTPREQIDRFRLDLPIGAWLERLANGKGPRVLDTGVYQAALAAGKPEPRPLFAHFTAEGVVWDDGRAEAVDSVIFATGYRPNLAYLAGLGALDAEDQVQQKHGVSLTVPGLYFVGLSNQRTFASATLRGVGADAALVVRHLKRHLRTVQQPHRSTYPLACCLTGSTSASAQ